MTQQIKGGLPRLVEAPLAFIALLILSPIIAVSAIAVSISSRGPAIFRQQRVGKGGRLFTLYKLRSMRTDMPGSSLTAAGDERITPVGRFLRSSKLDELPELWNIVRGDMSFVGPRPELPKYVDLDDPRWKRVLQARPGLTDPVTIELVDEESILSEAGADRERFYTETLQQRKIDGYLRYLETRSVWCDLRLIIKTIVVVLRLR